MDRTLGPEAVLIRRATPEDAEAVAALLVRSIRELCGPDYNNDETILSRWCANKTPEQIRHGMENGQNYWTVALDPNTIAGTALMTPEGEILLCYVLPEYVHRGIGNALLTDLLRNARTLGLKKIRLESTRSARDFYRRNGFIELGKTLGMGVIPCFTMERTIGAEYA